MQPGDPLSASELKCLQHNPFENGGKVSIFFQLDPKSASTTRRYNVVWKALCELCGFDPDNPNPLDEYAIAFLGTLRSTIKEPMRGQKTPKRPRHEILAMQEAKFAKAEPFLPTEGLSTSGKRKNLDDAIADIMAKIARRDMRSGSVGSSSFADAAL